MNNPPPTPDPVTGTLTAPTHTINGNFNAQIALGAAVHGLTKTDITLTTLAGDGITGIDFEVLGVSSNYQLVFTLPDGASGRFRIAITGMVTIIGESQMRTVDANTADISYDTITSIAATFGTVLYPTRNEVRVPITLGEDVSHFAKTDCEIRNLAGDAMFDAEYWLVSTSNRDFLLIFEIPDNRIGVFSVDITGYVWKTSNTIRDDVVVTEKIVPFNTTVPQIIDFDAPDELTAGVWDYFIELNSPMTGVGRNEFTYQGDNPGTPDIYLASDLDIKPNLPAEPTDPNTPPDCFEGWRLDSTGDSTQAAKYVLLRFPDVPSTASGPLEIGLREPNQMRGAI